MGEGGEVRRQENQTLWKSGEQDQLHNLQDPVKNENEGPLFKKQEESAVKIMKIYPYESGLRAHAHQDSHPTYPDTVRLSAWGRDNRHCATAKRHQGYAA